MTTDNDDIDSLIGAYALDALDADERSAFEERLRADPDLRAEADAMLAVAGVLAESAADSALPAPDHVWEAIVARTGPALTAAARVRLWPLRLLAGFGAAAAVAAIVLGVWVVRQSDQIDDLRADRLGAVAAGVASAPGSVVVTLEGELTLEIVVGSDGTGYVLGAGLPPLTAEQTYQLWAIVDDEIISAGVLGSEPGVSPFRIAGGTLAGFALTVEEAGGVVTSEQDPVAIGLVG